MALLGACSATPRDLEISRCDWLITWTRKIKTKTQVQRQSYFNFLIIKNKYFFSVHNVHKCKLLQGTFFISVQKMGSYTESRVISNFLFDFLFFNKKWLITRDSVYEPIFWILIKNVPCNNLHL